MEFLFKNIDKITKDNYIPIILVILTIVFAYCVIKFWIPFFNARIKNKSPDVELENLLLQVKDIEMDENLGEPLIQDEVRKCILFNGKKQSRQSNAYAQIMYAYSEIRKKEEAIKVLTIDFYDLIVCNSTFASNVFKAVSEIIRSNHVRIVLIQSSSNSVRLLMLSVINCIRILGQKTESSVEILDERPKD